MTDGTSQGLFIVVAIVIFSIFVSLSYTLFGKILQPQIVNLFDDAIEIVSSQQVIRSLSFKDWSPVSLKPDEVKMLDDGFNISPKGNIGAGLELSSKHLRQGVVYQLSFDITKISGDIIRIGGHMNSLKGTTQKVYIDGIFVGDDFTKETIPYKFDNKKHNVKVDFTAIKDINDDTSIYIQPNRYYGKDTSVGNFGLDYSANIENIKLTEI